MSVRSAPLHLASCKVTNVDNIALYPAHVGDLHVCPCFWSVRSLGVAAPRGKSLTDQSMHTQDMLNWKESLPSNSRREAIMSLKPTINLLYANNGMLSVQESSQEGAVRDKI